MSNIIPVNIKVPAHLAAKVVDHEKHDVRAGGLRGRRREGRRKERRCENKRGSEVTDLPHAGP